jgi:DNA-binding LytR/AlgR family response regulator
METQSKQRQQTYGPYSLKALGTKEIAAAFEEAAGRKSLFQGNIQINPYDQPARPISREGKKSFLVFRHNKYVTVPTDTIAFFYVKNEYSIIVSFDRQEYFVNYSLEHIQNILPELQFFRLNRQYLISFNAVKEVEHYFARKLLVKLVVPVTEKLIVSKEKASSFFRWLENR